MKESVQLRKRFCKDFNLPIAIFESPYFEDRLNTIDKLFNCVELYDLFLEEVDRFNTEEEYFAEYNAVKDRAISYIQSHSKYAEFSDSYVPKSPVQFPKMELYSDKNCDKVFFSIDMRKANFSTLRLLFPEIVDNCDCWEDFIGKFTDLQHLKSSKYIRQVILGACNPKKQTQWEKYLMEGIAMSIDKRISNLCHIVSVSTDEILVESDSNCSMSACSMLSVIEQQCPDIADFVRVSKFKLQKLSGFGWVKKFIHQSSTDGITDEYEFKCVEAEKFHILVELYNGGNISDDDLVFMHNGKKAKYLDALDFKLVDKQD